MWVMLILLYPIMSMSDSQSVAGLVYKGPVEAISKPPGTGIERCIASFHVVVPSRYIKRVAYAMMSATTEMAIIVGASSFVVRLNLAILYSI